jgi:hypothetical protein
VDDLDRRAIEAAREVLEGDGLDDPFTIEAARQVMSMFAERDSIDPKPSVCVPVRDCV